MKKVKCGYDKCWERRVHYENTDMHRSHRMVEAADDFDETVEKCFCSFECACYSGYMTLNGSGGKYIVVDGHWWLKDPSGGKDKRFVELNSVNENGK